MTSTAAETIETALAGYPGRGVATIVLKDDRIAWLYFLTGRSEASRSRRVRATGATVIVEPIGSEGSHDALRHYTAVRPIPDGLLVDNGDHVDKVADRVAGGDTLASSWADVLPEPDPPLMTPRIAVCLGAEATFTSVTQDPAGVRRTLLTADPTPGTMTLLTTYSGNRESPVGTAPIRRVTADGALDRVAERVWASLDPDVRVALIAGVGHDPQPLLRFGSTE